jgi:hypothetical protein
MSITTLMETKSQFIVANTAESSVGRMQAEHIIPVFAKDNEVAIAHHEFVQQCYDAVQHFFNDTLLPEPQIRVSHPIQGRIPEAMHKKPAELLDHEKTLYYERMMFLVQVPSVTKVIDGKVVNLVVAGVKAFNQDKMHGKTTPQKFKVAIGFQVHVCSNLCIFTDGYVKEIYTSNTDDLYLDVYNLCASFHPEREVQKLQLWADTYLSEVQFWEFIGKVRSDFYNPKIDTSSWLGDQQMAKVVRGYFINEHFACKEDGSISLWNLYNLLTEANKSSYVDTFLDRYAGIEQLILLADD